MQVEALTEALSGHSLFARADETRRGYLTLRGGHRMGLCGHITRKNGQSTLRDIASVCIRIAGEWRGCADGLISRFPALFPGKTPSVLIIGAPGSGKTTLLRDLTRQMADTMSVQAALIDQRGELAACVDGVPQSGRGRIHRRIGRAAESRRRAMVNPLNGAKRDCHGRTVRRGGRGVRDATRGRAARRCWRRCTARRWRKRRIARHYRPCSPGGALTCMCCFPAKAAGKSPGAARPLRQPDSAVMTRLLFPIRAALLSTLAGLHLSTHLRQEEQRLARWGEVLPHSPGTC